MADWQSVETAPKDRKVDLWAKIWLADGDRFVGERFPDCRWDSGDSPETDARPQQASPFLTIGKLRLEAAL